MVKWYSKKPRWRGLRHGKRGVQRRILLRFHIGGEREREREGVREREGGDRLKWRICFLMVLFIYLFIMFKYIRLRGELRN
jgi:hypothetical protein